jgi:hypothetical protein
MAEGALECLDVSWTLERAVFVLTLRSIVRSSVSSALPTIVVTQPSCTPYGLILSSKLIRETYVPARVIAFPLFVIGRTASCFPGKQCRNNGRRVAREAATIPSPGSTMLQHAILVDPSRKVGLASTPGMYARRINEAMLASEPRPSRHPADIFVDLGMAAFQITVTGRSEKTQSVKAFIPPAV